MLITHSLQLVVITAADLSVTVMSALSGVTAWLFLLDPHFLASLSSHTRNQLNHT